METNNHEELFLRKSFFLCGTYRNDDDLKLLMCRARRNVEVAMFWIERYLHLHIFDNRQSNKITNLSLENFGVVLTFPSYKSEIFMEIIFPMWHFVWHLIVFGAGLPTKYNIYRVVPTPSQPADHRNGRTTRLRDCIDSTNSWPQHYLKTQWHLMFLGY